MRIERLAEHSVDVDLLPEAPVVLDAGCRGFDFSHAVLDVRPNARIIAMDPAPESAGSDDPRITFLNEPLVGLHQSSQMEFVALPNPAACFVRELDSTTLAGKCVETRTLLWLFSWFQIQKFDLVKLDVEGSEFGILETWPGPIATQISVEFHDHVDNRKYDEAYFNRLFLGSLADYEVVQHELSEVSNARRGHWDSLFRLRGTEMYLN
jgi:FkbM family methyltransferase